MSTPETTQIVFTAGAPLTVLPLDVTHKALTSRDWIEQMRAPRVRWAGPSPAGPTSSNATTAKNTGPRAPPCDPCTIAWLIQPDLFAGRHINVEIETQGAFTTGMTVADWWRVTGRPANALFLRDVDRNGLFTLLGQRITGLDRR